MGTTSMDATGNIEALSTDPVVFSIVIPTKQEERYIGTTLRHLRSARGVGTLPFEIVVVDGASTDSTVAQTSGLADQIVTDSELACVSIAHARNVGGQLASGAFIFHTDADVLPPNLPLLLARAAEAFADPRVVAVTAPVMPYPWEATRRDVAIHRVANAFFRSSLWYGALFSRGECQIVRRTAFEAIGGYVGSYISGEDCDLFRRIHRTGRIVYLTDVCVHHSPRRFRAQGYVRTFGIYVREWVWMNLLRRSFMHEWPVVR